MTHRLALGPLAWLLCFQYFVAEQAARAGWTLTPSYRAQFNYISDLGAVHCVTTGADPVCSPLHAVMNGAFALQGLLIVVGAISCKGWLPRGPSVSVARALLVLSGVGLALVGAFPEDVNPVVHYRVAAAHFLCADFGMLLLGAALVRRSSGRRALGLFTLACGAVALVGLALLGAKFVGDVGIGAIERIAAYPFPFWLALTGAVLLREPASSTRASATVS